MPTANFNFTNRQRLTHRGREPDIQISVTGDVFNLEFFDIERFQFPHNAIVLVEPYLQQQRNYILYGTVDNIKEPPPEKDRQLQEFRNPSAVRFMVKVVDSNDTAKILASADSISPIREDTDQGESESLLPVVPENLGPIHWRVSGLENEDPVFQINVDVYPNWRNEATSQKFMNLVYPAALQQILSHILLVEKYDAEGEGSFSEWLNLGRILAGRKPPEIENDSTSNDDTIDWIEEAANGLARKIQKSQDDDSED